MNQIEKAMNQAGVRKEHRPALKQLLEDIVQLVGSTVLVTLSAHKQRDRYPEVVPVIDLALAGWQSDWGPGSVFDDSDEYFKQLVIFIRDEVEVFLGARKRKENDDG